MYLARFPRVFLAHLATPLEPMERLSKELGVEIWIKRDDCTGMSTGGNKTRKLEFLMAEALEQGADMVMTQGATQTNHGRQTAAFAAKLGLKCHILLEDRTGYKSRSGSHGQRRTNDCFNRFYTFNRREACPIYCCQLGAGEPVFGVAF